MVSIKLYKEYSSFNEAQGTDPPAQSEESGGRRQEVTVHIRSALWEDAQPPSELEQRMGTAFPGKQECPPPQIPQPKTAHIDSISPHEATHLPGSWRERRQRAWEAGRVGEDQGDDQK